VREDVALRVPIDGRWSSSRHGEGDLKESQQTEPEASRVHFLVVISRLVYFYFPTNR
jgi:hypothetical protein